MRYLEAEGYYCTRSAGSHGVWDVCAVRKDHVRFIQVKTTEGALEAGLRLTALEMQKFEEWACPSCCTREVWWWVKGKRKPSVKVL
jgi:Holliday junction resolvase